MKMSTIFAWAAVPLLLCAAAFAQEPAADSQSGVDESLQREISVVMAEQRFNLNPHTATYSSEAQVLDALYEGLYSYDPRTLDPVPALATGCKVSRDKKKLTFTIREGASFSDGSAITAFSVRNSWLMLLSTPGAPYASMLDCVRGAAEFRTGRASESEVGITARDDRTLVVNLVAPTAHFNKIICHPAFSVRASQDSVFSGAFTLAERTGRLIVLRKNPRYWDAANVHVPSVRISTSDDIAENAWDFNSGKIDWVVSAFDSSRLLNRNAMRLSTIFGTEYIFFRCDRAPFDRADVRNALIAAVPWTELRKLSYVQATTLVYPLSGYPQVEGLTDTSLDDARELMEDARKAAGLGDAPLRLTMGVMASSERQRRQFETLREAWLPLGVELEAVLSDDARYIESISSMGADLFVYSWIGDFADPVAFLELFRDGSTLNQTAWRNAEFDAAMAEAAGTADAESRYKLLSRAERILLDDGVILPVSHQVSLHALNPGLVGGWFTNALDIHPYKYLFVKPYAPEVPNVVTAGGNGAACALAR